MVFQNDILAGAAGTAAGYTIDQSIRFNDNDSPTLQRTFGSAGGNTWTFSCWMKRGNLGKNLGIFYALPSVNSGIGINPSDQIIVADDGAATYNTTAVFRDPSAWYHIVFTGNGTLNKVYVNNVLQTLSGSPNIGSGINKAVNHKIGEGALGASNGPYMDGYFSEIVFVDGTELSPTDFGETNDDGVWVPKAYEGTYGTNGFYITGEDSADLGADYSGNGNDFTSSGLTSDDQRGDTPTANHATWNPLFFRRTGSYKPTFADGNLYVAGQSSQVSHTGTTISSSGKHYAEFLVNNGSSSITGPGVVRSYWDGGLAQSYASNYGGSYYGDNGTRYYNATSDSQTAPGANRVGIEVDFANNEVEYFIVTSGGTKTSQGGKLTSANGIDFDGEGIFSASLHDNSSRNITAYFEEADWWGTPNAGYKALSTANLPGPAIADGSAYFQTTLYTGTGSTLEVNQSENSTFQPDFVWIKKRSAAELHELEDAVRGASLRLSSDRTDAENTGGLTSFDADGFTVDGLYGSSGENGSTYTAWQWLAANGTASNTDGDITSTVSVNTTAGFSVLTYSGSGTTNDTVGHGLGVKPSVVIVKPRNASDNWIVNDWSGDYANKLKLNATDSTSSAANFVNAANSTTFTLGSDINVNGSGRTFVAYCWNEVEGFSKFGSYTGNGSTDGPFVWCGFRPAFVLVKRTNSADNWVIVDSSRNSYNVANLRLYPDTTNANITSTTHDFLSNGFKLRASDGGVNGSGSTYIFMAFAEHPFGGDGAAPVPAR